MNDPRHPLTRLQQKRLLNPRGGGAAVLVPARPGTRTLVLGTAWTTLPRALTSLGSDVTWLDWYEARLRFGQLLCEPGTTLTGHVDAAEPLPVPDGAFDFVFADIDEITRAVSGSRADVRRHRRRLLVELRRVLTDDGTAVVATSNPLRGRGSFVAGQRTALGSPLAPWGRGTMHAAGFTDLRVVVPYPTRDDWQRLIPEERLREDLGQPRGVASSAGWLPSLARRAAAGAGAALWVVPEYLVLARGREGVGRPRMLAESLEAFTGEAPAVIGALGDARVTMRGDHSFVKFPLSVVQQRALGREIEKTHVARTTGFEPFTLPWAHSASWHGIPYSVFPLVKHSRSVPREDRWNGVLAAIDAQPTARIAPLRTTAIWHRLHTERGCSDVGEIGAELLLDHVVDACGEALVPVGATHGDLHALNVIPRDGQNPVLIDWNRFEASNPLFLDPASAAITAHRDRTTDSFAAALVAFADGALDGALAQRARDLLGELTPQQAATLVLLDRIVSYGPPRSRYRPWKLEPLLVAAATLTERLSS